MSKKSSTPAADPTRFDAFTVREYEVNGDKKSDWTKVGVAWPHQDGKGFRLVLIAVPLDGIVVLRQHEPKAD